MFVKHLLDTVFFKNGCLGWENIDKFSLKDTSPPLLCLKIQLILVFILGSK